MDYELRINPECPNSASALNLFRQGLAAENTDEDIRVVQLDSEEQASAALPRLTIIHRERP